MEIFRRGARADNVPCGRSWRSKRLSWGLSAGKTPVVTSISLLVFHHRKLVVHHRFSFLHSRPTLSRSLVHRPLANTLFKTPFSRGVNSLFPRTMNGRERSQKPLLWTSPLLFPLAQCLGTVSGTSDSDRDERARVFHGWRSLSLCRTDSSPAVAEWLLRLLWLLQANAAQKAVLARLAKRIGALSSPLAHETADEALLAPLRSCVGPARARPGLDSGEQEDTPQPCNPCLGQRPLCVGHPSGVPSCAVRDFCLPILPAASRLNRTERFCFFST